MVWLILACAPEEKPLLDSTVPEESDLGDSPDDSPEDSPEDTPQETEVEDTGPWDEDGDGFYAADDCDDEDSLVNPDQQELPGDGVDQDCDGYDACHDLDCDGVADVVWPVYSSSGTALSLVQTAQQDTWLETLGAYTVLAQDVTNDGVIDLVFAQNPTAGGSVADSFVYLGPDYSDRIELLNNGALRAAAADLDGDGHTDLVFANYQTYGSLDADSYVFWGPDFTDQTAIATHGGRKVLIEDLDQDGHPDLVFACTHSGTYYNNNWTGSFATDSLVAWGPDFSSTTPLPSEGAFDVELADVDGDGWTDVALSGYRVGPYPGSGGARHFIYLNQGGSFDADHRVEMPASQDRGIALADFDGDGHLDLAGANWAGGDTWVYYGPDYDTETRQTLPTVKSHRPVAADANADGYPDLIIPQPSGSTQLYLGSATGLTGPLLYAGAQSATLADLDADGYLELLLGGSGSSSMIYSGSADGPVLDSVETVAVSGVYNGPVVVP